ncbi:unnamed protein product [Thlaspi arvense]|uniref:Phospholipase D C-terminal domain-containing protein n=1 Tax=Thlaspi arvense TaxID=13288 RepID=A0AAU9S3X8_THLAR|nr:unnamed protein product [Thlaspi arvense]
MDGSSIEKGGPREPWHDIHCQIEGPAAWDVLYNFEQRWLKQARKRALFTPDEIENLFGFPSRVSDSQDSETWNVQIFRSIDILLGSSYGWESKDIKDEDIGALHIIPKELSLKIASKIKAGERFAVYVVIPMWPEGIPESGSVQAILDWQKRTVEMMYKDIYHALKRAEREAEELDGNYKPPKKPDPETDYDRAQKARRFMIYVHSKMMIVDDEYIIVARLTSIKGQWMARGIQRLRWEVPAESLGSKPSSKSKIHDFECTLVRAPWFLHYKFFHPESLECIRLPSTSLPISISDDGTVTALPGFDHFPDTKAPVLGTKSEFIPALLTT